MISFGKDILNNYEIAAKKEWLITNGIGGYASSTVIGCNTRRYHGLLVASLNPPSERTVLVSKLEEVIQRGQNFYFLSTNKYPQTVFPQGFLTATNFSLHPFPKTSFCAENVIVEKSIFMVYGENTTIVTYEILSPKENVTFSISPLVVCRDFHWLMRETVNFFGNVTQHGNEIVMKPFEQMPSIHIRVDGMEYTHYGVWYKNMEYELEQARGLNYQEDLFNPGRFSTSVQGSKTVTVILSDHSVSDYDVKKLRERELARIDALLSKVDCKDEIEKCLVLSADKFLVKKKATISNPSQSKDAKGAGALELKTIIAGYPWFGDWGRDTMIAIPGLLLELKKHEDAKKVLTTFANAMNKGLIPNRFSDYKGEPEYNTIDASLWFVYAGYMYYKATGDTEFTFNKLLPWFEEIYNNYMAGTLFNIKVDEDGLVYGGDENSQLTWMDVKINDVAVTKRYGKPVEVNALWFNMVSILQELTKDADKKKEYAELVKKVKDSFVKKFWNESAQCLYDVLHSVDQKSASVRPNQIFAVSLKFSLLDKDKERAVFNKVRDELLTPYGLRSLSKSSEAYIGKYEGNQYKRDMAYHQGTVWSWLIGAFIDAYIKVEGVGERQLKEVELIMRPLYDHINDNGIGGINEIFDGDRPHAARGCILQAWSVAEVLRVKKMSVAKLRSNV